MLRRALAAMFKSTEVVELSAEEFTARVAQALREENPYSDVTMFAPLVIDITGPDHLPQTVSLGRHYDLHRSEPGRLDSFIIRQIVDLVKAERLTQMPIDPDMILPSVVKLSSITDLDPPQEFVDPISEQLALVYVFDLPGQQRPVTAADLEAMEIERDNLLAIAVGNLERHANELVVEWHGNVAIIENETISPAALLACLDYWAKGPFADRPVLSAIAPRANTLIVYDPSDADAAADALTVATDIVDAGGDHALATDIIAVKG
jgi:hypothetical protein